RPVQGDVSILAKQRRHGFVPALGNHHGLLDALLLQIAFGDGDIGRHKEHRAHDLVVADLYLGLCPPDVRVATGNTGSCYQAALDDASAVKHVISPCSLTENWPCKFRPRGKEFKPTGQKSSPEE